MPQSDTAIPENVMREAVSAVLAVRLTGEEAGGSVPVVMVSGPDSTRLESLGVDSLITAEIIVELEQRLDTLLELTSDTRLETFDQLRAALRPVTNL